MTASRFVAIALATLISCMAILAVSCGANDEPGGAGLDAGSEDAHAKETSTGENALVDASQDVVVIDAALDADACGDGGCDPVVFLTSKDYTGAMGGVLAADQECTMLATAAGLTGTFKAWLSAADAGPPATRFKQKSTEPYRLRDGRRVAVDFAAFTKLLEAPISVTEKGEDVGFAYVWTATDPNGTATSGATDCKGWTSDDANETGGTGESDDQSDEWTIFMNLPCSTRARLYCFEQRP